MVTARNSLDKLTAGVSTRANLLTYFNSNLDIIDAALAKCNFAGGATAPDGDNDETEGYVIGSKWHTDTAIWECTDPTEGAAVWEQTWPAVIADIGTNVDFGAYEVRAATFQSDVATGTAPLIVASTTLVTNLHAANSDALNGLADTAFVKAAGTVALSANWDAGSYKITAQQLESDVATGTAPLIVASTTLVTNLHAANSDDSAALGGSSLAALTSALHNALSRTCQGRLTLETGVPIPVTDQTAKTTIYFTPYMGDLIALYESSAWVVRAFVEASLELTDWVADKNYDIFGYWSGGVLTLESVVWTNDTTRATALATQNGIYVKTGSTEKRYLGTIRTTGTTGQCEDSVLKRYVWNYFNRIDKTVRVVEATDTWTYNSATWRSANNSTANRISAVFGLAEDLVQIEVSAGGGNDASVWRLAGVGVGVTNASSANLVTPAYASYIASHAIYKDRAPVGYQFYQWVEACNTAVSATFYGDVLAGMAHGLFGIVKC